ncbi:hypothetical protein IMCC9480_3463 [Oxalobacteraceae bacterium IMCC9480]|nr:hypothetical protein IMCC9480_3463 [Oxalobacteraceae bacterium IMCC9480]
MQHPVAGLMAMQIIEVLEKIHIQHQKRQRQIIAPCPCKLLADSLLESATVLQAGQGIGGAEDFEVLQCGFEPQNGAPGADLLADLARKCGEVGLLGGSQVTRRVIENGDAPSRLAVGVEQEPGSDVDQVRMRFGLRLVVQQVQLRCCAAADGLRQRDHIGLLLLRQQRILPLVRLASLRGLGQGMREAGVGDEVSGQRHDRDQEFPRRKIVAASA